MCAYLPKIFRPVPETHLLVYLTLWKKKLCDYYVYWPPWKMQLGSNSQNNYLSLISVCLG